MSYVNKTPTEPQLAETSKSTPHTLNYASPSTPSPEQAEEVHEAGFFQPFFKDIFLNHHKKDFL